MVVRQNTAIAHASGDIVVFLDDDAVARPEWLERLVAHYADPSVGGVGGRDVVWMDGVELQGRTNRIGQVSWFGRLCCNHHRESTGARAVSFLKGCNMSYRRDLVGPLDPLLWGPVPYGYEVDVGLRVRRAGYRLVYDPAIEVDHFPTSHMGADAEAVARVVNHNQTYVLLKHLTGLRRLAFVGYTIAVGDLTTIGLLRIPLVLRRGWSVSAVRAHLQGKVAGFRTWRGWSRGRLESVQNGSPAEARA